MEDKVLMIVFEDPMPNGRSAWVATVQNSGTMIPFVGETVEEQQASITALANRMSQFGGDVEAFEEEMATVLEIPDDMTSEQAFGLLYEDTDTLFYSTRVIFEAESVGVDALADCLVEAGLELLLMF